MDELGFTKIAAAGLATVLGIMLIRTLPEMLMHHDYPATPAYSVGPVITTDTGEAEPLPFPQPEWITAMDATRGAKVFKKCQSCHSVENGGKNGTGPNLWNVVGNTAGSHDGFSYSAAMSGMGVEWSYEELDGFLTKPAKYLSGTKMAFVGLKKAEDRAAVIEYLRLNADSPLALPLPAAIPETEKAEMEAPDMETPEIKTETAPQEESQEKLSQEEQSKLE
jgi:cytochrome c